MEYKELLLTEVTESVTAEMSIGDRVAILALIASIIAIIISLFSMYQNHAINVTNLQSKYFEKIFTDYIVEKIPVKASKIHFTQEGVLHQNYKELIDTMMDMVEHSIYFAYAKHEFYKELSRKTIALEDKLIENASVVIADKEKQDEFIYHIHEDVMDIIKLINKNYHDFL